MARFRREDTSIFQEAAENHTWLVQHHPTSFPTQFQTIRVKEYATAMIRIFGTTLERHDFYTHGEHTILMLPNYNPYIARTSNYRS